MLQLVCNNIYAARVQPPGLPALAGHEPQAHQWHRAIAVAEPHARILRFKDLNMIPCTCGAIEATRWPGQAQQACRAPSAMHCGAQADKRYTQLEIVSQLGPKQ